MVKSSKKNKELVVKNIVEFKYNDKNYKVNNKKPIFDNDTIAISLFSGCGGLDIGTQLAGVRVISSIDNYKDSVETQKANKFLKNSVHMNKDVKNIDGKFYRELLKNYNYKKLIVIGGPPCQPFSKAAYWKTNEKRDSSNDPRNMIDEYFRLIKEIDPDGFIFENVESLQHPSNIESFNLIKKYIIDLGYNFKFLNINAIDYGIPQKRKRIFFIGSKNAIKEDLLPTHGNEKEVNINSELKSHERVIDWIGKFSDVSNLDENLSIEGKYCEDINLVPPGGNYIDLTEKRGFSNPKFVAGKRYWTFLLKLNPNMPSWTIIASPGHWEGPFHWNNRRLSIREIASIQTFPEDFLFVGSKRSQRKQIGNAVPPLLAKSIVEYLCRWL